MNLSLNPSATRSHPLSKLGDRSFISVAIGENAIAFEMTKGSSFLNA
jgi:hypothetical protein